MVDGLITSVAQEAYNLELFGDHPKAEELSEIVKEHAIAGVAAGFVPVPGMDVAALGAVVFTMYARINVALGIKLRENAVKSIATAIGTNMITYLPGVAVGKAVGTALKFVPGLGTVAGIALDAAVNLGLLYAMGVIYAKSIVLLVEAGEPVTEASLRDQAKKVSRDRHLVRGAFERGKAEGKRGQKRQGRPSNRGAPRPSKRASASHECVADLCPACGRDHCLDCGCAGSFAPTKEMSTGPRSRGRRRGRRKPPAKHDCVGDHCSVCGQDHCLECGCG